MKPIAPLLMKHTRIVGTACVLASASLSNACAACASDDPKVVAESFFAKHAQFASQNPSKIKAVVTSRFFNALEREYKCTQDGVCAIESDPWTDAQDGHIGKPVAFATVSNSGVEATVSMSYPFILDKNNEQKSATLVLQRDAPTACWLIGDLKGPLGESLLHDVEEWHKKYGQDS